jgi:hypothetical protein
MIRARSEVPFVALRVNKSTQAHQPSLAKLTEHRVDLQYQRATARQAKEISEQRLSRRSFFAEADPP